MIQIQPQGDGVTAECRAKRTVDPAMKLRNALRKRDRGFLDVAGYGLMDPGASGEGTTNPIGAILCVRLVEGTSDYVRSAEHKSHRITGTFSHTASP